MSLVNTELKAKDVMTADPVCVSPSTRIRELARVFEEHEISGVPVTDQEGKVIGVVSKTDLIRRCSEGTDDIPPAYLFEVLSEQGADVDEAMQLLPAAAAEAANPTSRGSDGERNQQHKCGETHGDVTALGDILPHFREIEKLVQPNVGGEVQAGVEKRKQAEHAANADQIG